MGDHCRGNSRQMGYQHHDQLRLNADPRKQPAPTRVCGFGPG